MSESSGTGPDARKATFAVSNDGIGAAFEFVRATFDQMSLHEALAHRASVIIDELCSNMIRHDATLTPATSFALHLQLLDDGLKLEISDPGQPFDPLQYRHETVPEIGGHGISLVKGLSRAVHYERTGDLNVLTIVLETDG